MTSGPRVGPASAGLLVALATVFAGSSAASAQWTHRYTQVGSGHHVYLEGYELPTLTAGPMDAAVSPDGGRVVYADRGWLWVLDLDTRIARQLTDGGALDSRPRWSPDGRRIVFVRDDGSDTWIAEVVVASGEERIVADTDAIELEEPGRGLARRPESVAHLGQLLAREQATVPQNSPEIIRRNRHG